MIGGHLIMCMYLMGEL